MDLETLKDLRETLVCACAEEDPSKGVEDRSLFCYRAVEIVEALDSLERALVKCKELRDRLDEALDRDAFAEGMVRGIRSKVALGLVDELDEAKNEANRKDKMITTLREFLKRIADDDGRFSCYHAWLAKSALLGGKVEG